jgi:hypothetical protein
MLVKAPPQARLEAPEQALVHEESDTLFKLKKLAGAHQHREGLSKGVAVEVSANMSDM